MRSGAFLDSNFHHSTIFGRELLGVIVTDQGNRFADAAKSQAGQVFEAPP